MDILKKVFSNPMFWVAVIYLILPVDIVPDAMPVVGTLDDLVPVFLAMLVQARKGRKQ